MNECTVLGIIPLKTTTTMNGIQELLEDVICTTRSDGRKKSCTAFKCIARTHACKGEELPKMVYGRSNCFRITRIAYA